MSSAMIASGLPALATASSSRQQLADVGDLLVDQQQERVFKLYRHGVLVGHEVRREVAAVELHAFDHFQLVFEATTFIDGDDAFLADFLHGIGDDLTDVGVAVGGDGAYLGDGLRLGAGHGQLTYLLDGSVTAWSMPRFRSIGFMPAVTPFMPSVTMA